MKRIHHARRIARTPGALLLAVLAVSGLRAGALAALPAPTNLAASVDSCWGVRLDWDALPGADSFSVTRGGDVLYTHDTFFRDTAAPAGSSEYSVAGIDAEGPGASASADGYRPSTPSAPAGLVASDTSCTLVFLSWGASAEADSYRVARDGSLIATLPSTSLSYTDAVSSGAYAYTVSAGNACGWSGPASETGHVLAPPATPTGLSASDGSCGGIVVVWNASSGADGYRVLRDGGVIADAGTTSYTDTSAAPGSSYSYSVIAWNACGQLGASAPDTGSRAWSAPGAPAGVAASDTICGLVRISWGAVAHADSYDVYRAAVRVGTVTGNSFDDAPPPGTYAYAVAARNSCGTGPQSGDSGTRPPDPPSAPTSPAASDTSCHFILVTWGDVANEAGYRVRRDGALVATLSPNTISYQDGAVASGTTYSYTIEAYNSCGASVAGPVSGTRIFGYPDAPDDVAASDTLCSSVAVRWTYPGAPGQVDSFQVLYRLPAPGSPWVRAGVVGSGAGPQFLFTHAQTPGSYVYEVAAYNDCGSSPETEGSTDGATALTTPAAPAWLAASDTLCSRVDLQWAAAASADTYVVFRDGSQVATVAAPTLVWSDAGTTGSHAYAVRGANRCGRSGQAADTGFGRPPTSPPHDLWASTDSCGVIRIAWQGAENDTGYYLYRDGTFLTQVPSGVTHYRDTAAAPGAHSYRIGALGVCGRSDSVAAAGIRPPDPPAAPAQVTASDTLCGRVVVTWSAVANADSFTVYRNSARIAAVAGTSYEDVPAPGNYAYEVSAKNRCGEGPKRSDPGTRPPDAPAAPSGVSASDAVCGSIDVSWSEPPSATGYRVLREGSEIAEVADPPYRDESAAAGSSYVYTVVARNRCGESAESTPDVGHRPWDPPAAPTGVSAGSGLCAGIAIEWTDGVGEDGYVIERDGAPIDTVGAGETAYFDGSATAGPTHAYRVGAFNGCGPVPAYSAPANGFRLPEPVAPSSLDADSVCGGVALSWADVSWETGYVVVRDGAAIDTLAADVTEFTDQGIAAGTAHEYRVGSFNACSPSPVFGGQATGKRPYDTPAAPAGTAATDGLCGVIRVSWSAASHADGYRVFRGGSQIATTAGLGYDDTAAPPGTYAYTVRAWNSCGESAAGNPDAGTRLPDQPMAPWNPAASDTSCQFIQVTWGNVENEQGYRVYRDGARVADLSANTTIYRDAFVSSGTTHTYQIEAYNACGAQFSLAVQGERILGYPPSPSQTAASDGLCDRVAVTWTFPSGTDADSFTVSARDSGAVGWTRIASVPASAREYAHTPSPGAYDYLVQAGNNCGLSPETSGSTDRGARLSAPLAPVVLSSSDREVCGAHPFRIVWRRVQGATRYVVVEGAAEHGVGADTVYTATKTEGGTYSFRVRAENACGPSAPSETWKVQVQAVPAQPGDIAVTTDRCGAIRLSWTPSEASNVWIESDGDRVYLGAASAWSDSVPGGGARAYSVGGWNLCDTLAAAALLEGFAYPLSIAAPVGVSATEETCDSVRITWSYFPEQIGVDSFRVFRFEGPIQSTVAVLPASAPRVAVDRNISAGRTYAYRVRAESRCAAALSGADTGYAEARPAAPTWNAPAAAACAGAPFRLRWNGAAGAMSYEVRLGTAPVDTTTATETTLRLDETGSPVFRVAAWNTCGYGPVSDPWTVLVSRTPSVPSEVRIDTSFCDSVVVRWSAQADSVRVYRSDRAEPVWEGPGTGSAVDTPARAVTYRVRSFNGCGESDAAEALLARPRLRPPAPSTVTASDETCDSVRVTWSFASLSGIPIDWVDVVRTRNDTTIVVGSHLAPASSPFWDRGGNGTYIYEVIAHNACGASTGTPTSRDAGGFLPEAPEAFFAAASDTVACLGEWFTLRWEPIPGVLYYRIWETIGQEDRVVGVAEAGRDSFSFRSEALGGRSFRLQAGGICGIGEPGPSWSVAVLSPPSVPAGLAASTDRCGEVFVTWSAAGGVEEGVRVFRDGTPVGFVPRPGVSFADRGAAQGVAYTYSAVCENLCGVSAAAGPVEGSTLPGIPPPLLAVPADGASDLPLPVRLEWASVEGAAGYALRVEGGGGGIFLDTLLAPDTSLVLPLLELGETYRWRVATRNACGPGLPSAWRTFNTLAVAPSTLSSDPANGETEVDVDVRVRVVFSVPVDPTALADVRLLAGTDEVEGIASLEEGGAELLFEPSVHLEYGTTYTFDFSRLYDVFGRSFEALDPILFTTKPAERPFGDMDGDYQRDLADVDLAVLLLLGLRDPAEEPMELIDLNADGRVDVADLVLLARTIVTEGISVLDQEGGGKTRVEAHAGAGGEPGQCNLSLACRIPSGTRALFVEVVLPEGAGRVLRVAAAGAPGTEVRHACDGGVLRALALPPRGGSLAGDPDTPFRLDLALEGGASPNRVEIRRIAWSDGEGGGGLLRPEGGAAVPVGSHGAEELRPNRPNPFNPATEIHYYLPRAAFVRLRVLDPAGRLIRDLVGRAEGPGWHAATWDGTTASGADAGSGVYFACLETPGRAQAIRMILVR